VITVPLGILLTKPGEKGHITFFPSLPGIIAETKKMGFGPVVKVILEFKSAFWQDRNLEGEAAQLPELDFLLSEEYFSTWWTHEPGGAAILTGWVGGPDAEALQKKSEEEILEKAISSLANSFLVSEDFLKENLSAWSVHNWGGYSYSKGAYSFETLQTEDSKKRITQPVEETIYFAGEAFNEEESIGTVESAIASAKQTVKKILSGE
jgi:monoamine oxidase